MIIVKSQMVDAPRGILLAMLSDLLAQVWSHTPRSLRRLSMRLVHTRFTVTAGAVVIDDRGRVLLLEHRFRGGSGWGIPGGFIEAGEQPHEAIARELCEEVGLEVSDIQIIGSRGFSHQKQIEILFKCRSAGNANPRSGEIRKAQWFSPSELPPGLPGDQSELVRNTLHDGAKALG